MFILNVGFALVASCEVLKLRRNLEEIELLANNIIYKLVNLITFLHRHIYTFYKITTIEKWIVKIILKRSFFRAKSYFSFFLIFVL